MSDSFPREWTTRALGEVCPLIKDGTHLPPARVNDGPLLLSVRNLENGFLTLRSDDTRVPCSFHREMHAKWQIEIGDVLLAIVGATLGKTGRVPPLPPFTVQRSLAILRGAPKVLSNDFLALVVQSPTFQAHLWRLANQTAQPGVYLAQIAGMHIPVPTWIEQHRIASILDTLDETIRKTEQLIAKLKLVKQGLLHDLLTRGVDENGEVRNAERNADTFEQTVLGRMPKDWALVNCAAVCRDICVGIVIQPSKYYCEIGVPILRSANVREHGVVLEDIKYMSAADHRLMSRTSVAPGDVVTVRTGYPGTTAVIPESLPTANCVDLIITRPGPLLLPQYLAIWVNSDFGRGQVLGRQGGLAQQHFNIGEMKELLIALPSLNEQRRIVEQLEAAQGRLALEHSALTKLHLIKTALMEDLLTGRVRTTHLEVPT